MSNPLYILSAPSRHQETIRKSRFRAHAVHVESVDAAMTWLARTRDAAATHNCWAYRIGSHYRFDDDGEPGGSAGQPILQAIDGQHCAETVVMVTRWFGGTKLGVGGLVRAYGGTAAECLHHAKRHLQVQYRHLSLRCEASNLARLHARCSHFGAQLGSPDWQENRIEIDITIPEKSFAEFTEWFANLTRGHGRSRDITSNCHKFPSDPAPRSSA
ncbi:MAG TPA: YigZ family protein [Mizugakiibacter sp.]|nr:YigZ family protein [Mizugakiibacter sp.]